MAEATTEELAALRGTRPYPAITLVMPTDRRDRLGDKSRILLRDLVTEAKRRLADDPGVDRDAQRDLLHHRLDPGVIENARDSSRPGDALVAYLAAGEPVQVRQFTSPWTVAPRVEFSTSFLTRYLVAAEQGAQPYLVLVLDQKLCRLFRGAARDLAEVKGDGFPYAPQIPSPEDAVPGPIPHAAPYEDHEAPLKQYLRALDGHLGEAVKELGRPPLFLVGSPKMLTLFVNETDLGDLLAGTLPLTGMETVPAADLARRLEPALEAFHARQVAGTLEALDTARGRGTFAGGAAEVWTAVADKRVSLLVVDEGCVMAGRISDDRRDLEVLPAPEPVTLPNPKQDIGPAPHSRGVSTDIVEQLVEDTLCAQGRVQFVPDGTLAATDGVAAVLRF
ncbi:baeRF3 domain-containing protein [Streptacidiphilus anmyonensis]|uniref:baeRF3 domain-containing protein n=1 Tax=Streptacidiphilus anmyonensis TaxID=405782 RepID=UPI0005A9D887|nr:hypothetical protein [Streptacidiphilus anmyonensis]